MKAASSLLLFTWILAAQKFEVASIKPMQPGVNQCAIKIDAARVELGCQPLSGLIARAYKIEPYQLSGPDWMVGTRFDVLAKLPDGASEAQVPAMLQALLAERFKLVAHRESKEEPVYAMTVAKGGPKLKPAKEGDLTTENPFPNGRLLLWRSDHESDGWLTYSKLNDNLVFEATRITLGALATVLMKQVDLPVVDQTGLSGAYEIFLVVANGPNGRKLGPVLAGRGGGVTPPPSDQAALPTGVDIFKSVQTLGLQLVKSKTQIERLVIEHLEKLPTEN